MMLGASDHGAQRVTAGQPPTKGGAGACEAVHAPLLTTRPYLLTTRPYLVSARPYLVTTPTYLPRAGIGRPLEYFTREYDHTNSAHHLALGFKSPADAERFKELVWPQVLARAK